MRKSSKKYLQLALGLAMMQSCMEHELYGDPGLKKPRTEDDFRAEFELLEEPTKPFHNPRKLTRKQRKKNRAKKNKR